MKKLKYVFWLVFVGFFALLVFQNLDFFSAKYSLHLDLGFYQKATPEWTNGAIIAGFVGIGVFIMLILYFSSRFGIYRANKTIKELRGALDERTSAITGLKNEIAALQSGAYPAHEIQEGSENMAGSRISEEIKTSQA